MAKIFRALRVAMLIATYLLYSPGGTTQALVVPSWFGGVPRQAGDSLPHDHPLVEHDGALQPLGVAISSQVLDEKAWSDPEPVQPAPPSADSKSPVLAIDKAQGLAHLVWEELGVIRYAYRDPSGWHVDSSLVLVGDCPAIALDAGDEPHIVYADIVENKLQIFHVARAEGVWSLPHAVSGTNGPSTDPDISLIINGEIHVVWADKLDGDNRILHARSKDGGDSWYSVQLIPGADGYGPTLALGPQGQVWVAWQSEQVILGGPRPGEREPGTRPPEHETVHSTFSDIHVSVWDGEAWSQPENVSLDVEGDARGPDIVCDSTGLVHLVWEQEAPSGALSAQHSQGQLGDWSPPLQLSGGEGAWPRAALAPDNSLFVAWDAGISLEARHQPVTGPFGESEEIARADAGIRDVHIAVDGGGVAYAAWSARDESGTLAIYYGRRMVAPAATLTPTATATMSATHTVVPTLPLTPTATLTSTPSPSVTPTASSTETHTSTPTETPTASPSPTASATAEVSLTPTATAEPTVPANYTATSTPTETPTPRQTANHPTTTPTLAPKVISVAFLPTILQPAGFAPPATPELPPAAPSGFGPPAVSVSQPSETEPAPTQTIAPVWRLSSTHNVSDSPTRDSEDAAIVAASSGVVYAVWTETYPSGSSMLCSSTRSDSAWTTPACFFVGEEPDLAIGADGRVHLVYSNEFDGKYDVFYTYLEGTAWALTKNLSQTSGTSSQPAIAIRGDGVPMVVWTDTTEGQSRIYYGWLANGVWNTYFVPSSGGGSAPDIAVGKDSRVWVSWQVLEPSDHYDVYVIWGDGTDWNVYSMNVSESDSVDSVAPRMVGNPLQGAFLVWQEEDETTSDVYYADNLASAPYWDIPSGISGTVERSEQPDIARDAFGRAYAAWDEGDHLVLRAHEPLTGTWLPSVTLASGRSEISEVRLAGGDTLEVYALWSEPKELAKRNIYSRSGTLDPPHQLWLSTVFGP